MNVVEVVRDESLMKEEEGRPGEETLTLLIY